MKLKFFNQNLQDTVIYLLISCAFLIPREFNLRWPGISFSITDGIFGAILVWWLFIELKNRRLKSILNDEWNRNAVFLIAGLGFITVLQVVFNGPAEARYFMFRDLCAYGALSAFLVSYNLQLHKNTETYVLLTLLLYLVLSVFSILVVTVPPMRDIYITQFYKFKYISGQIGYGMFYANALNNGILRPTDMIGGFGNLTWASIICLPLAATYFGIFSKKVHPVLLYCVFIPMILSVFYLMSRANIIGLSIIMVFLMRKRGTKYSSFALYGMLVVLLIYTAGLHSGIMQRFYKTIFEGQRLNMYIDALRYIAKNPLLGIGLGHKVYIADLTIPTDGVDSLYLTLGMKFGILYAAAVIAFLIKLFHVGYIYIYTHVPGTREYSFILALFSMLVAFLLMGIFSYPFSSISFNIFFWLTMGIYARILKEEDENAHRH